MLTNDEADKIIARHGERGIDAAFFLLVDTLTEGEAKVQTALLFRRFSREQVMSMSDACLTLACSEYVLRDTVPCVFRLDWSFAMKCRDAAVKRTKPGVVWDRLFTVTDGRRTTETATAADFARAALMAVAGEPE